MAYYLKFTMLPHVGDTFNTLREIEAYSGSTKIPLTCIYATTTFPGYSKDALTDGITDSNSDYSFWIAAGVSVAHHLIFKANTPFDTVKAYCGTNYNLTYESPKNVELYTVESSIDPDYNNPLWLIKSRATYPDGVTLQTHDLTIPPPPPVPIHRWRLDKDCVDSVGGLATLNNGGVTFDPVNGASFNGVNQWLSFTKSLPPIFSLTFWAKFYDASVGGQAPFSSMTDTGAGFTGMKFDPVDKQRVMGFVGSSIMFSNINEFNISNYPNSLYVLCTLTYNNGICSIYRGSSLLKVKELPIDSIAQNFAIGRGGGRSLYYFKGNILDARIYDVAQTQSDVTYLNSLGANGDSPLVIPKKPYAWVGGV